ncbi:MAG TPA: type II toxin-antitoxin system HicB family antitoxin [bacterium]|nr:type II toxin-antitoxin system HicB family antitoxin [bacterium]
MGVTLSAVIHRRSAAWLARCPEVGTMCQGATYGEALANLKRITEEYLKSFALPEDFDRATLATFEVESPKPPAGGEPSV